MGEIINPYHYKDIIISFGLGIITDIKDDIQHEKDNVHNYVAYALNYRPDIKAQCFHKRSHFSTNILSNHLAFINNYKPSNRRDLNIPLEIVGTLELYKHWNIFNQTVDVIEHEEEDDDDDKKDIDIDYPNPDDPTEFIDEEFRDSPKDIYYVGNDPIIRFDNLILDNEDVSDEYIIKTILEFKNIPYNKSLYTYELLSNKKTYIVIIKKKKLTPSEIKDIYDKILAYNVNGKIVYDNKRIDNSIYHIGSVLLLDGHEIVTNYIYDKSIEDYVDFLTFKYKKPRYDKYATSVNYYGSARYRVSKPITNDTLFIFANKQHNTIYTILEDDKLNSHAFADEENRRIYDILIDYKGYVDRYREHAKKNKLFTNYIPYENLHGSIDYHKGIPLQLIVNEVVIITQYNTGDDDNRYSFTDNFFYDFGKGFVKETKPLNTLMNIYDTNLNEYLRYTNQVIYSQYNLPISYNSNNPAPQLFKVYGLMNNHIKLGNNIYLCTLKNDLEATYLYNSPVYCYYYSDISEDKYIFMPYDIKANVWNAWKWKLPSLLYRNIVGVASLHLPKKYRLSPYIISTNSNANRNPVNHPSWYINKYRQMYYYNINDPNSNIVDYINMFYDKNQVTRRPIATPINKNSNKTKMLIEDKIYDITNITNAYGDRQKEKGQYDYAEFDKTNIYKNNDYIYVKENDTKIDLVFWLTDELPYPESQKSRNKALFEIPLHISGTDKSYSYYDIVFPFKNWSDVVNNYIITIEELNHELDYWVPYQSLKYPKITKNLNHHISIRDMLCHRRYGVRDYDYGINNDNSITIKNNQVWKTIFNSSNLNSLKDYYESDDSSTYGLLGYTDYDALYYRLATVKANIKYNATKESVLANVVPALQNVSRHRALRLASSVEIDINSQDSEKEYHTYLFTGDYEDLVLFREIYGTKAENRTAGIPTMCATAFMLPNYKANRTPRYWLRGEEIPYLITGVIDGIEIELKRGVYKIPSSYEFIRYEHPALYLINYDNVLGKSGGIYHYIEENSLLSCNPNGIMHSYHPFAWSNVIASTKKITQFSPGIPHIMNTLNNKLKKNGMHKLFKFEYEYDDNNEIKYGETKYGQFVFYPMWQRLPFLCFTLVLNYSSMEEALNDLPPGLSQIKVYIAEASSDSLIRRDIRGKEISVLEDGYSKHNIKNNRNAYRLVKTFTLKNSKGNTYNELYYNRMVDPSGTATDTNSWLRVMDYDTATTSFLDYEDPARISNVLDIGYDYIRRKSMIIAIPYIDKIDYNYTYKNLSQVNSEYKEYALNFRNDKDIRNIYKNIVKWTPDFYLWDYPVQNELAIDNLMAMGDHIWDGIGAKYVTTVKNAFVIIEGQDRSGIIEKGRIRVSLNQHGKFSYDIFRKFDYIDVCSEEILSFAVFKDNLILFTRDNIYLVVFQDITNSATWYVANRINHKGALHEKMVAVSSKGVYFANESGVYITDGISVECISDHITSLYKFLLNSNYSSNLGDLNKIAHDLNSCKRNLKNEKKITIDKNAKILIHEEYYKIEYNVDLLFNETDKCLYIIFYGRKISYLVYNTNLNTWHYESVLDQSKDKEINIFSTGGGNVDFNMIQYQIIQNAPRSKIDNIGVYHAYTNEHYFIQNILPRLSAYLYTSTTDYRNGILYYHNYPKYKNLIYNLTNPDNTDDDIIIASSFDSKIPVVSTSNILRNACILDGCIYTYSTYFYQGTYTPNSNYCGYGYNHLNYKNIVYQDIRTRYKDCTYNMYCGSYGFNVVNEIRNNTSLYNRYDIFIYDSYGLSIEYKYSFDRINHMYSIFLVNFPIKVKDPIPLQIVTHKITNGIDYYTFDKLIIEYDTLANDEIIKGAELYNILPTYKDLTYYQTIDNVRTRYPYNSPYIGDLIYRVFTIRDTVNNRILRTENYVTGPFDLKNTMPYVIRIVSDNNETLINFITKVLEFTKNNRFARLYINDGVADYVSTLNKFPTPDIKPMIYRGRYISNMTMMGSNTTNPRFGYRTYDKGQTHELFNYEQERGLRYNYLALTPSITNSSANIDKLLEFIAPININRKEAMLDILTYCIDIIECIKVQGRIYEKHFIS